jgi:hypothetical protein
MFLELIVFSSFLSQIEGLRISDNFLQCNQKNNLIGLNRKCISANGSDDIDCLNYLKQLKEINDDDFGIVNGPTGKEVVYAKGKERYATKCAKINTIRFRTSL